MANMPLIRQMIKSTPIVLLLVASACASQGAATVPQVPQAPVAATSDWTVAPNARSIVLGEATGATITLVPIVSPSDESKVNYFLFQAVSTGSDHDGLVIIVKKTSQLDKTAFISGISAEPYSPLIHSTNKNTWLFKGYEYIERDLDLHVLDTPVDADAMLRLRKKQEAGTRLAKLEPATLLQKQQAQDRLFQEHGASPKSACGLISTTIDWSTVSATNFEKFSISGRCRKILNYLTSFCEQYPDETAAIKDTLTLSCALDGPEDGQRIRITSGTQLHFSPGRHVQDTKLWDQFLDTFGGRLQVLRLGSQEFIVKVDKTLTLYRKSGGQFYPVGSAGRRQLTSISMPQAMARSSINLADGQWNLGCGVERHPMEILVGAERQAVLDGATYADKPLWPHEPYFLARDLQGVYYYVDRYKRKLGGKRYRVFVGRRGQLKLTKLKRIVEDSEGTLFSTDSGDLRLVVGQSSRNKRKAIWLSKKKKTNLTAVSIPDNARLIYDELGVYYGEDIGLVCQ